MTALSAEEWPRLLQSFSRSARHLERQPFYNIELDSFRAWQRGERSDVDRWPALAEWRSLVERHVAAGRTIERARIETDPPTEYQLFERWVAEVLNVPAGEMVITIAEPAADAIGIATAGPDWWLLDDKALLVMPFDAEGNLGTVTLSTDPTELAGAVREWRLAVSHGINHHEAATPAQWTTPS